MLRDVAPPDSPLRFSIVTAVYDVARYLDAFIASIDDQTFPADRFEVIAVDDGSTDDSLARLRAWAERRPDLVTVLTKENGGQSTARNLGLEVAQGEWVTFTDPDDVVERDYLAEVDAFLTGQPQTLLVATNRLMLDDATGEVTDSHPLNKHFVGGNRLRDIDEMATYFHGSAPAAFLRLDLLHKHGIRFDPEVRPNFEDGHFCSRYVLAADTPLVGFVATARYHYRKRRDATSTLGKSTADPDRYTKALRNGYLALLRESSAATGQAPEWLQNYVLYELSWYFSTQEAHAGAMNAESAGVVDEYHDLLRQILELVSDDVIAGFDLRRLKRTWKEILLHSYKPADWHPDVAVIDSFDEQQRLIRLTYRFTGELPQEQFLGWGKALVPQHAKIRDISYHGRVLLRERIVWLPLQLIRLKLNGHAADLQFTPPEFPKHRRGAAEIRKAFGPDSEVKARPGRRSTPALHLSWSGWLTKRLSRTRYVRRIFGGSWVLIDRIHDADDSAERLFRHLRGHRTDINAWFVIERGTPDWKKLRAEGYSQRVVAHGSLRWKLLMANCVHLVSSHADVPVMHPSAVLQFHRPTWRFTFLQHGVIKDDLSTWLNPKHIDLFITSTQPEHESIVGDHTPYTFTSKETKLTGLPRFDRLLEQGNRFGPDQRDLLLISPTWRNWLVPPLQAGSQRRTIVLDEFLATDYARNWLGLLNSPQLAEAAERRGLTIGFLPHPNIQPILAQLDLPPHVKALNFSDHDVQEIFARSAVLVTDYSSIAFNAAYIERPSVYFQFDRHLVLEGGHTGRKGYFSYERDGFGPVTYDVDGAVQATIETLEHGPSPSPEYQERIEATFPLRDGRCCERVVDEIDRSTRPVGAGGPRGAVARGRSSVGRQLARRSKRALRRVRTRLRGRAG